MRRSYLKRTKKASHITFEEAGIFRAKVFARDGDLCIGVKAGVEHKCGLPMDVEHLVEQRDIKRLLGPESAALTDLRLVTCCCRWLNGALHVGAPLRLATESEDTSKALADERARRAIRRHAPAGFEEAVDHWELNLAADKKLGAK